MRRSKSWILVYILTISAALASVQWGSRAVNVISESMPIPRANCIVIDPGHGGPDGGAASCTGKLEKVYNLEISRRLETFLNLLGYSTRMIRTTDESVYTQGETIAQKKVSDLKQRVKMVEETENPILISIHQNTFSDSRYCGAQVFYAGTQGSETLALQLQGLLTECLNPGSHRKAKRSSQVYLMDQISCPGILVECGFLSNIQEETLLSDPAYQKKLCAVIGCALDQFLSHT